jgi:2,4-dienoyl-CoA reductase-like NADH-dependent reductase (Old Yellow Enzyme family)
MLQLSWVRRYAPGSSIFVFPAATVRGFVRGLEGGWDIEQTVAFARALESRGCDAIHVSSGGLPPARRIPASPRYQANRRLARHPLTHFSIPPSIFARVRQGLRLGLRTF